MNRRIGIVWLVILLLSSLSHAQTWRGAETVALQVNDAKGRAVDGARVVFTFQGIQGELGPDIVVTDGKGRAVIADLAAGPWQVEVTHPDYLSFIAMIDVRRGKKPLVSASFLEAGGRSLNPIKVKVSKGDSRQASPVFEARGPAQAAPAEVEVASESEAEPTGEAPVEIAQAPPTPAPPVTPPPSEPTAAEILPAPVEQDDVAPEEATPAAAEVEELPVTPATTAAPGSPEPEPMTEPEAAPQPRESPVPEPDEATAPASEIEEAPATPPATPEPVTPEPELISEAVTPEPEPMPQPAAPEPEPMPEPEVTAQPTETLVTQPEPTPEMPAVSDDDSEPDQIAAPAEVTPEAEAEPVTPEPAAAPIPEPEPTPPAVAVTAQAAPADPGIEITSHRDGSCTECASAEWTLLVSSPVPAMSGAAPGRCDVSVLDEAQPAMRELASSIQLELNGFIGPIANGSGQEAIRVAEPEIAALFEGTLAPYVGGASPCQLVGLVLPKEVRFSRVAYAAADAQEGGVCTPGKPCAIEDATWLGSGRAERGTSATVVYGLFQNSSSARGRRAFMKAYYRPPNARWQPRLPTGN